MIPPVGAQFILYDSFPSTSVLCNVGGIMSLVSSFEWTWADYLIGPRTRGHSTTRRTLKAGMRWQISQFIHIKSSMLTLSLIWLLRAIQIGSSHYWIYTVVPQYLRRCLYTYLLPKPVDKVSNAYRFNTVRFNRAKSILIAVIYDSQDA